jgi:hypothetical protein
MDDLVDWLNKNSGAVQAIATVVLVLVTAFYVILTRSLSKSAAKQADASAKMAEEMREQRLAVSQPLVMPDFLMGLRIQLEHRLRITNGGNGPAIKVNFTIRHPWLDSVLDNHKISDSLATLLAGEYHDVELGFREDAQGEAAGDLYISWQDIHGNKFSWLSRLLAKVEYEVLSVVQEDIELGRVGGKELSHDS